MMELLTAAVPSLLGGLFGRKKQQTTTRVDYQYIRDAASKAGFNPLTALKNGGWANATTTQPNLSAGQFVSEAMQRGLDTWFNREERAQDRELRAINLELARAELDQLRNTAATLAGRGFGYDLSAVSAPALAGGSPQNAGQPQTYDRSGQPLTGNIVVAGEVIEPNPNMSDTAMIEERYGDVLGAAYGTGVVLADAAHNLPRLAARPTDGPRTVYGSENLPEWARDVLGGYVPPRLPDLHNSYVQSGRPAWVYDETLRWAN